MIHIHVLVLVFLYFIDKVWQMVLKILFYEKINIDYLELKKKSILIRAFTLIKIETNSKSY